MEAFEFHDVALNQLDLRAKDIQAVFQKHGLLVFPGILKKDPHFTDYLSDLNRVMDHLLGEPGLPAISGDTLDIKLGRLLKKPEFGKYLADLGTQPCKFVSGNRLKFCPEFIHLAKLCLGPKAFLGTPSAGDTLHLFFRPKNSLNIISRSIRTIST